MYKFVLKEPDFLPHIGCDVELSLEQGETLFLTGENGLGKSTLLKKVSEKLSDSYLLSQSPLDSFYDRRLDQYISAVEKGLGDRMDKEVFARIWRKFGLDIKMDRLLSQLSGGERQCVKLATGLALHSPLLLLDEPSQYLDQEKKAILFGCLQALNQQGKSLLIVEHDLSWWKKKSLVVPLQIHEKTLTRGEAWTIS